MGIFIIKVEKVKEAFYLSANLEVKHFLHMIPGFVRNKKDDSDEEFFMSVAKARQEWYDAQNYF